MAAHTSAAAQSVEPVATEVDVHVQRDGDIWIADFDFARSTPVWAFAQSGLARRDNQPWRLAQWTVLTPGVLLQRTGHVDTFSMADGTSAVPPQVRVLVRPTGGVLFAANQPALVFSNGAVALYGRQFEALAVPSLEAARALPQDPGMLLRITPPARVTLHDSAGPVLAGGQRVGQAVLQGAESYVLFGNARQVDTPNLFAVIDTNLPAWIADEMATLVTSSVDFYAARLGARSGTRPTVMVAWDKSQPNVISFSGTLLPNLMLIPLEGARLRTPQPPLLQHLRWLVAHEAAHFWLGQEVTMASDAEAWIGEGGADLMGWRAMQQLQVPGVDVAAGLRAEVAECAAISKPNQPLATARQRQSWRAPYACGLMLGLVAEGALRRSRPGAESVDFFDFIGPFIARQRSVGSISVAAWCDALLRASGDAQLVDDIRRFTDDGVADPKSFIDGLLQRAGVRL